MTERRMLILPAELVRKIEENRGDLSQAEFIKFLINSRLEEKAPSKEGYVTTETLAEFEHGIKELMRSFMDFFVSYGLELGQSKDNHQLEKLTQQLQELETSEEPPLGRKRPRA